MKNNILTSILTVFFLFLVASCYSQELDLIVTAKGDSIVCNIDSITNTQIYYEMIVRDNWTHTQIDLTNVSDYKRNAIDKKQFVFKSGTSIIESRKQAPATSMKELQKNSIYVGILSFSYSRLIPGENVGVNLAGGLNFVGVAFGDDVMFMGEISLLTGGTKHFFEPGFLIATNFDTTLPMVRTGYRYQGPDGFLFRAGILLGYDDDLSGGPALSIGYSF